MIYRVLIDQSLWLLDLANQEVVFKQGRLGGVAGGDRVILDGSGGMLRTAGLSDVMFRLGLPAPAITNPRARFYFTELGWRKVGGRVAAEARKRGHVVRVIRRKNPRKSRVIYRDPLQVAILPATPSRDDPVSDGSS